MTSLLLWWLSLHNWKHIDNHANKTYTCMQGIFYKFASRIQNSNIKHIRNVFIRKLGVSGQYQVLYATSIVS